MRISIRAFRRGDAAAFRTLNEAWIAANFTIEDKDLAILGDPQRAILDRGGHIEVAEDETGEIVGCCALLPAGAGVFEIGKMTVAENWRGRGIGRQLLRAAVEHSRALGATRLYLETNHTLTGAIALYLSEGFRHLRPEAVTLSPYARADVFMERRL